MDLVLEMPDSDVVADRLREEEARLPALHSRMAEARRRVVIPLPNASRDRFLNMVAPLREQTDRGRALLQQVAPGAARPDGHPRRWLPGAGPAGPRGDHRSPRNLGSKKV